MYQAHFGLQKGLFDGGIAHEDAVFLGPRQQVVVANFKVALTTFDSAIVLTGAAGGGKTTLTVSALRTTNTRLALGWLASTPTNGPELIELLLAEFGLNAHRVGRVERLQMWRQFLNEMSTTDSRVFIIAEHADEMETEALRTLEGVTAADPNGCLGANLILLGQPELNDRLKQPSLASLNQRVRLRQRLDSFSVQEVEAYLKHRVALASGNFDNVFERDAVAALYRYSGGVPRVVNNLCETALTLAATGAEQRVTSQLVMRVAVGLYGIDAGGAATNAAHTAHATIVPSASATVHSPNAPTGAAIHAPSTSTAAAVSHAPNVPTAAPPQAGVFAPAKASPTVAPAPNALAAPPTVSSVATSQSGVRRAPSWPAPDVPVLTDAIEAPAERKPIPPRAEPKPAAHLVRSESPHHAPSPAAGKPTPAAIKAPPAAATKPAPAAPAASPAAAKAPPVHPAPAREAPRSPAAATASAPTAPPRPARAAAQPEDAERLRQTQTMRALASATSIDDISNSMAETLFGEADLDMLSAALASAGWSDDDEPEELLDELATTSLDISATMETPKGQFASFGRRAEPLELVDDSPTGKNRAAKTAGQR